MIGLGRSSSLTRNKRKSARLSIGATMRPKAMNESFYKEDGLNRESELVFGMVD